MSNPARSAVWWRLYWSAGILLAGLWASPLNTAEDPGPEQDSSGSGTKIDEVETRDGSLYRGEVIGYDIKSRSYVLRSAKNGGKINIPEGSILTVRAVTTGTATDKQVPRALEGRKKLPLSAITLPPVRRADDTSGDFLSRLLGNLESLQAPHDVGALKNFDAGIARARERRLEAARTHFQHALGREPDCLATRLFLGAIFLVTSSEEHAFQILFVAHKRNPEQSLLLEMLTAACKKLGYVQLESRFFDKWIAVTEKGARRHHRIFEFKRKREPLAAATAWKHYLDADPRLVEIDSPENKLFQQGKAALDEGNSLAALEAFSRAVEFNGFIRDFLRPYRIRALEQTIRQRRATGSQGNEILLAELEALRTEAPRDLRILALREDALRELIGNRLSELQTPEQFEAALARLAPWIPELSLTLADTVRKPLGQLTRKAIESNLRQRAEQALALLRTYGGDMDLGKEFAGALGERVQAEAASGRVANARAWIELLASVDTTAATVLRVDLEGPATNHDRKASDLPARPSTRHLANATPSPQPEKSSSGAPTGVETSPSPDSQSSPQAEVVITTPITSPKSPASPGRSSREGATTLAREVNGTGISDRVNPTAGIRETGARDSVKSDLEELMQYFPLHGGSWWIYRHGNGTRDTLRLEAQEKLTSYGIIHRFNNQIEFESSKFTYNKNCFFHDRQVFLGQGTDPSVAEPLLAAPPMVGRKWSWKKGSKNEIICEREYVDMKAEVTCRAGHFDDCLVVRSTCWYEKGGIKSRPVVQHLYFARGVGLVKVESENPLDGKELESYTITESIMAAE